MTTYSTRQFHGRVSKPHPPIHLRQNCIPVLAGRRIDHFFPDTKPTMTLPRWFDPRTMALSPTTVPDDEEVDEVSIANRGSCNASPVKQMLESTSNKFAASVQVSGFAPTATAFAAPQAAANVMGPPAPVVRPTTPSPTKKARKVQQAQAQQQAAAAESSSRSGRDSIANLLGAGETPPFFRASFGGRAKFLDTVLEVVLEAYSRPRRQGTEKDA